MGWTSKSPGNILITKEAPPGPLGQARARSHSQSNPPNSPYYSLASFCLLHYTASIEGHMNYIPLKIIRIHQPTLLKAQKFSNKTIMQNQKSHAHYIKLGTSIAESDLISSYCQWDSFSDACKMFNGTPDWDIISANKVIGQFAKNNRHKDAISLFTSLLIMHCTATPYTFRTLMHFSIALRSKQCHSCAR